MASGKGFEEQSAALDALRGETSGRAEAELRKALRQRNNFLVAKAARLVREMRLTSLTGELADAFRRFMLESGNDPAKIDPQCWAKNDIAKTLAEFEYQEYELFLSGMRHHQMEPVWNGRSDTAGALRGTCALALVQCREVGHTQLLGFLIELFADSDSTVRINAVRAVEQVGSDAALLMLKLRAELAGDSSEVLGACYAGVLRLTGPSAIPWAARFLAAGDDAAAEAALAIAETHTIEAYQLLKDSFDKKGWSSDPWFRSALLSAIALTRLHEAADWLLDLVAAGGHDSAEAHRALCDSAPSDAVREQLSKLGRSCPPK